jgi:hypothetical protein
MLYLDSPNWDRPEAPPRPYAEPHVIDGSGLRHSSLNRLDQNAPRPADTFAPAILQQSNPPRGLRAVGVQDGITGPVGVARRPY